VYRVAGEGTREFSTLTPGDEIDLVGPNGRGWPVERIREMASGSAAPLRVMLMGGGIGIPPLIGLAEALAGAERAAGTAGTGGVTSDGSTKSKDAGCAGAASIQTIAVFGLPGCDLPHEGYGVLCGNPYRHRGRQRGHAGQCPGCRAKRGS